MNVLIVNDDGADALGLTLLRDAARKKWGRHPQIVSLASKKVVSGCGSGMLTKDFRKLEPEQVEKGQFVVPCAAPVDLVNLAFYKPALFVRAGGWDLVMSGVNHRSNVGLGGFRSGTVFAALWAAFHYGVCGWAFSQAFGKAGHTEKDPRGDKATRKAFANSARYLSTFLASQKPIPGECWTMNFPAVEPTQGWVECQIAPYEAYIGPGFLPVASKLDHLDAALLDQGFMTRSQIFFAYNPPLPY